MGRREGRHQPPRTELRAAMSECYAMLRPAVAVEAIMSHENLKRVHSSQGFYMEPVSAESKCHGCDLHHLPNCTARRLMWHFLGHPDTDIRSDTGTDVTVAGFWPSHAIAVADTFHESRAPLLLKATRERHAMCGSAGGEGPAQGQVDGGSRRERGRVEGGPGGALPPRLLAPAIVPAAATKLEVKLRQYRARHNASDGLSGMRDTSDPILIQQMHAGNGSSASSTATAGASRFTKRRLSVVEERRGEVHLRAAAHPSVRCAQLEAAELFLLSQTRRLMHLKDSAQADFILAQASQRAAAAASVVPMRVEPGVCDMTPVKPIGEQRMGVQLLISERHKLSLCWVPKAGCTSLRSWFRQHYDGPQAWEHTPNQTHVERVLFPMDNSENLTAVSDSFSEAQAIRHLTRRDFVHAAAARNPYTRIASAYLSKHARNATKHYNRKWWSQHFFKHLMWYDRNGNGYKWWNAWQMPFTGLLTLREAWRVHKGVLLSFPEFVRLVEKAMSVDRTNINHPNHHINAQAPLCELGRVKYDMILRAEHLEEDTQRLLHWVNEELDDSLFMGKNVHPTNARSHLSNLYADSETFDIVTRIFQEDMTSQLNNISFSPPPDLEKFSVQ
eukprot:TRINITY_DN10408_c0_g1_i6.p1 TRINITY_DN10408_c0_g1~~TRINITY_DN10408_c0_g1_i6.p1  ORF type:complete len:689 (-),score=6.47 TRINITY_DN10408_c0_g1_i6:176-2020(-)